MQPAAYIEIMHRAAILSGIWAACWFTLRAMLKVRWPFRLLAIIASMLFGGMMAAFEWCPKLGAASFIEFLLWPLILAGGGDHVSTFGMPADMRTRIESAERMYSIAVSVQCLAMWVFLIQRKPTETLEPDAGNTTEAP